MRFLLAAYDPHHRSREGVYWAWWHPELSPKLLEDFYYRVAAQHLPAAANRLAPSDCHGGWASVDSRWAVVYRFFDGGRDPQGRPGRFVLLAAFYEQPSEPVGNAFEALHAEPFAEFANASPIASPVPALPNLEWDFTPPEAALEVAAESVTCESFDFAGVDAMVKASARLAACAPVRQFNCRISTIGGLRVEGKIEPVGVPPKAPRQQTPSISDRSAPVTSNERREPFETQHLEQTVEPGEIVNRPPYLRLLDNITRGVLRDGPRRRRRGWRRCIFVATIAILAILVIMICLHVYRKSKLVQGLPQNLSTTSQTTISSAVSATKAAPQIAPAANPAAKPALPPTNSQDRRPVR